MTLPDFRLIRLLPLASLVLTACTLNAPKGPGQSPDAPQWRQHQQDVSKFEPVSDTWRFRLYLR